MMRKDPYEILGVERNSSQEEILKAYRALAVKWHPDKNLENPKVASEKFKEITEAFDILGDVNNRKNYDFYSTRQFSSFSFKSRNSVDDVFDNIFSHFFGDQKNSGSKVRIKISLKESYAGCLKTIKTEKHKFCDPCKGTGSSSWQTCEKCSGKGFVFTNNGHLRIQVSCSNCGGKGSLSLKKCLECEGRGYLVESTKDVEIKIPPGIEDGNQIRIANEASDGSDLFVVVNVEKDAKFTREGKILISSVEVPYSILVLGGKVNFDLFGTKLDINIRPKSNAGTRIRLKNQGMPFLQNPNLKGDLLIDIKLKMPEQISDDHEKLLKDLLKISQSN
jgi:molecular chaperone DnaJ